MMRLNKRSSRIPDFLRVIEIGRKATSLRLSRIEDEPCWLRASSLKMNVDHTARQGKWMKSCQGHSTGCRSAERGTKARCISVVDGERESEWRQISRRNFVDMRSGLQLSGLRHGPEQDTQEDQSRKRNPSPYRKLPRLVANNLVYVYIYVLLISNTYTVGG